MIFRTCFPTDMILASASPRRQALLKDLGWSFRVEPAEIEELFFEGVPPSDQVVRLALQKVQAVRIRSANTLVIGADTIVVAGSKIFGKPSDPEDAFRMLSLLSGKTHSVITGVAVKRGDREASGFEDTRVTFRELSSSQIRAYLAGGESMDKAGAYAIQGSGSLLVRSIEGCYFNVVGLPLYRLSRLLEDIGVPLENQWGETQ